MEKKPTTQKVNKVAAKPKAPVKVQAKPQQKPKPRTRVQWLWEFSKKIVVATTVFYFCIMIFACGCVVAGIDSIIMEKIVDRVSDVYLAAVVGYAVKAGFENVFKIRLNRPSSEEPAGMNRGGEDNA